MFLITAKKDGGGPYVLCASQGKYWFSEPKEAGRLAYRAPKKSIAVSVVARLRQSPDQPFLIDGYIQYLSAGRLDLQVMTVNKIGDVK